MLKAREACAGGKFDDAQKLLERALQIYPQFAEALTLRGLLQLRANHIDQGRQDFEQAIQYDPTYGPAYVALGAAYNAQAHYDDALRTLELGTAISPLAWQGYYEMARASIGKGFYDKGLQFADRAEQLNGNHLAAIHLLKAYAMIPLKFYSRAKEELQAYLQHEPRGGNAEQARHLLAQLNAAEVGHSQTAVTFFAAWAKRGRTQARPLLAGSAPSVGLSLGFLQGFWSHLADTDATHKPGCRRTTSPAI